MLPCIRTQLRLSTSTGVPDFHVVAIFPTRLFAVAHCSLYIYVQMRVAFPVFCQSPYSSRSFSSPYVSEKILNADVDGWEMSVTSLSGDSRLRIVQALLRMISALYLTRR